MSHRGHIYGEIINMPKLCANGLRWLKGFHLIAVSCWIGGATAVTLPYFLKTGQVTNNGIPAAV